MPLSLRKAIRLTLCVIIGLGTLAAFAPPASAQQGQFSVLVFSKTAGFRHASIPDGIEAIQQLGQQNGFAVTATEDAGAFTADNLAQYDAVAWLSTTGDVLNDAQQRAFESYIRDGGGYAGVHAAADTEYDWAWYGDLVGAYFDSHPAIQEATVEVTDRVQASTAHLPQSWTRTDEWYNYASSPRGDVHVLAELDESSYDPGGGAMGSDHPIAWCQLYEGGRAWYTGMGHTSASYADPAFREHLLGGIRTAAGAVDAGCGATEWANFDQVTLAEGPDQVGEPMSIAVLPNGDVLHSERRGTLHLTTAGGETSVAAEIPVYTHDEEGLQSIALAPNFAENRWVYVYYAPPLDTPEGDAPETAEDPQVFEQWQGYTQLSRFTFQGGQLDLSSEQQILRVAASRGMCCHVGGDIAFGPDGNLYLSTGDDTNPFQSSGYTPIDERPGRNPAFDAQRTAANTNDLRGKILRIAVHEDGSYTSPTGNMFAGDGDGATRPEIYAMGFRNPFRMSIDQQTGALHVGNYGPDAPAPDPQRGPGGIVEFDRITGPGFYGWPYCVGDNQAYNDYDFATGESGAQFDCAGPVNESPNNDGLAQLPATVPAWLPYDGDSVPEFGSGGEGPMGGPVYHSPDGSDGNGATAFPPYYEDKFFVYEWTRGWIKTITVGEDGQPADIDEFMPDLNLTRPMDVQFGPDGSLFVLDYGSEFFGDNEDAGLYRIDYVQGQRSPDAVVSAEPASGQPPLEVSFSAEGSGDPDPGDAISFSWDLDGDGDTDSTAPGPTHTYTEDGVYEATLTVTDSDGNTGTASQAIVVGNTAPEVTIETPANGQVFSFGDTVDYEVTVDDADGTPFDCSRVQVDYVLGHSTGSGSHGHPLTEASGCRGSIETASGGGHGGADTYGILQASYTDTPPSGGLPGLTGEAETVLQPRHKQAEYFDDSQGLTVEDSEAAEAGSNLGFIQDGGWVSFRPYNLGGVGSASFRVASGGTGGTIEVRAGSPDGPLVASAEVPNTGGWGSYTTVGPVPVDDPGGTHELFLVFRGNTAEGLFNVDSLTFLAAPRVSATLDPPEPNGDPYGKYEGTYHTPVTVSLSAEGGADAGTPSIEYRVDGSEWTAYTDPLTVEATGEHTVAYRATDEAGNTSKADSVSFEIVPDACPGSDIRDTVVIDGADTRVNNVDRGDGCTVNDLIDADADYRHHGAFVRHVARVAHELAGTDVIDHREVGRIIRAAARSDVGT